MILGLMGKRPSGKEADGTDILGKKIKNKKNGGGEEYQVLRELYAPLSAGPTMREILSQGRIIHFIHYFV